MSDKTRWKVSFAFGLLGLVMAVYLLDLVLNSAGPNVDLSFRALLSISAAVLLAAGIFNFYVAFAFKYGVVDTVVGPFESATLLRSGTPVTQGARIQFFREVDSDNASIPDEARRVFFVAQLRPWSCATNRFLIDAQQENE